MTTRDRAGRLLVIDFDYFFPTPMMTAEMTPITGLYDWASVETEYNIGHAWTTRAAGFFRHDLPLPRCNEGYEEFWARFDLADAEWPMIASDSNLYAGKAWPTTYGIEAEAWEEVWLYDAHHDCYAGTHADAAEWKKSGEFDCATWMRLHHAEGSELHVRYPPWRADADGNLVETERPPVVPVDRQVDDGRPVPGPFDAVAICRSGAWVPSWCDDQFAAFMKAAPVEGLWMDERVQQARGFDEQAARAEAEMVRQMLAKQAGMTDAVRG